MSLIGRTGHSHSDRSVANDPGAARYGRVRVGAMSEAHCALPRMHTALGDAKPILSTCAGLSWPSDIDWQRWVSRNLNVRAVMVAVISIPIEGVFAHPEDDLQRAFLAVDVGEAKVGLMK
jgi:hypothetical protein